jgi:hypothetical protein
MEFGRKEGGPGIVEGGREGKQKKIYVIVHWKATILVG